MSQCPSVSSQQAVCKGSPSVPSSVVPVLFLCLFFSISFISLPNIFLAFQTLLPMLCLMTIFTFFLFWSCCSHCPILHSGAPPTRGTRWTSPRWTSLFCLSLPRDLLPPHLRHNRSGIRQYTAFCWQFGLTPLPLSDLNLCRFVSYLHQQQLSPASVRLYLTTLHYLQIFAVGHDPQPGEFFRLQYAVRAVQQLNPSRSRPLRLPITPAILLSLHRRWSPSPVSYQSHLLWAACCLGFFAFLQSGEFTCPSSAAYNSSMLSWGDIQVDSHNHPSYLRIVLWQSKTDLFGAGVSFFCGCHGRHLVPSHGSAVLPVGSA